MNLKNLTAAALLSAVLFGASSCKKDFVSEESINGEVVASNNTYDGMLETALPVHTPKTIAINSNVSGYYETLPALYYKTTKRYPVIIFIHGIGELGTGLSRLNCCGLPRHIKEGTFPAKFLVNGVYHSFIVITPQFRVRPSASQVQSVIDYAKNRYRIDPSRVYVTGLSMGGGSTWDWSVVYGQNAAAIGPVCAGAKPTTTLAASVATKNLPIWSLNSSSDPYIPVQWTKDWINWIDARNTTYAPKTKLTIWSGLTHNGTWAKAFNPKTFVDGYNLYQWFLLHRRGTTSTAPAPTTSTGNKLPVAKAGADQTIPLSWNYMPTVNGTTSYDPDGYIKAFKWTKISGPSSYWFSSSTSGKTKVNGLVAGTYVFRLTVTDSKGATAYDDVKITMTTSSTTSTSGAPVANAGADRSIPKSWNYMPTLNATLSKDYDGWIKSFKWSKISGPTSYWFSNSSAAQTKVNGLVVGTYVFRVTVTDNVGKTDTDDVVITITNN